MAERDGAINAGDDRASYQRDYAAWLREQIDFMRAGLWSELDLENLIDEVESLERWSFDEFQDAVKIVVREMLTWDVQEDERCRDWADRIDSHRAGILSELEDSPSYQDRREEALAGAYRLARFEMSQQDKMPFRLFPETCPYRWDDVIGRKHPLTREPDPKFVSYKP